MFTKFLISKRIYWAHTILCVMALGSKAPTDKIEDLAKREAKRQAHKSWSEPALITL